MTEGASMLIDFSFTNFKSFRNRQSFTAERTEEYWTPDAPYGTVAAIYGGNAAGKSNLVDALEYLSRFVRKSFAAAADEEGTGRSSYRLDATSTTEPSTFLVRFTVEPSGEYEYEFSVDDDVVRHERLLRWGSSRPSLVFERQTSSTEAEQKTSVKYGRSFRGPRSVYERALRPNALLLSVLASADNASIAEVFDFLAYRIHVYRASSYGNEMDNIAAYIGEDPTRAKAFQTLVRSTDLGISNIKLDTGVRERLFERFYAPGDEEKLRDLYLAIVNLAGDDLPDSVRSGMVEELVRANALNDAMPQRVMFEHEGEKDAVLFKEHDESDGTIATISFLSIALRDLSSQSVTVVDEIDSSLHPSMVRALVGLYQDTLTNPHGSQLVFTTHDVSLLMQSINGDDPIAPDQVWIVEKRGGMSDLYPITEFGVADDENMARNYLNGQYGGVLRPTLREAFAQALEILEDDKGGGSVDKA